MTDEWYITETIKGDGPRPEFLRPKYKSVESQAKAYMELEKRFGEAPERYELGDIGKHIDSQNVAIQDLMNIAKEHRVSQDAFQKMVGKMAEYDKSKTPDPLKELEKLGPEGPKKLEIVNQWAKNTLSPELYDSLSKAPQTADLVLILDELRQRMAHERAKTPPNSMVGEPFKPVSEKEVRQEIANNYQKYVNDPLYRNQLLQKLELAVGKA